MNFDVHLKKILRNKLNGLIPEKKAILPQNIKQHKLKRGMSKFSCAWLYRKWKINIATISHHLANGNEIEFQSNPYLEFRQKKIKKNITRSCSSCPKLFVCTDENTAAWSNHNSAPQSTDIMHRSGREWVWFLVRLAAWAKHLQKYICALICSRLFAPDGWS